MTSLRSWCSKLKSEEDGATMIEYALLAALIAVAAIVALSLVGTSITDMFNTVSGKLSGGA